MKAPNIELSTEGLVLGLIEVSGQDLFFKDFGFVHLETREVGQPRDDAGESFLFCVAEELVDSPRKWERGGAPGNNLFLLLWL